MDFAKTLLTKYGWEEGKGLGKDETGITTAIKPKLKFDNAGLGHDGAETFTTRWWEHAFNDAANNIHVRKTKNGISLNVSEEFEISAKKFPSKRKKNLVFNNFLKSATTLTNEGVEVAVEENQEDDTIEVATNPATGPSMTDEELFNACGGRTAHKGARHGLGLNGKLARVEEQERKALAMISIEPIVAAVSVKKKKSKKTLVEHSSQDEDYLQDNKPIVDCTRKNNMKSMKNKGIFPTKEMAEASNEENSPKKRKKGKSANVIQDHNDDAEENLLNNKNPATTSNSEIGLDASKAIPDTDNTMLDGTSEKSKKSKRVKGSPTHCKNALSVDETFQAESCPKKRKKNKSISGIEDNEDNNSMLHDSKQKRKKSKKAAPTSSDPTTAIDLPVQAFKIEDVPKKRKKRKSMVGSEDAMALENTTEKGMNTSDTVLEDTTKKVKKLKNVPNTSSDAETSDVRSEKRKKKKSAGVEDGNSNHVNCVGNSNDNNPDIECYSEIIVKKQKKSKRKQ